MEIGEYFERPYVKVERDELPWYVEPHPDINANHFFDGEDYFAIFDDGNKGSTYQIFAVSDFGPASEWVNYDSVLEGRVKGLHLVDSDRLRCRDDELWYNKGPRTAEIDLANLERNVVKFLDALDNHSDLKEAA